MSEQIAAPQTSQTPAAAPPPAPAPAAQPAPVAQAPAAAKAQPAGTALTTDAPKPETGADAKTEAAKPGAMPGEYKLAVPEGFDVASPMLSEFVEAAKADGLKPETAQKIVDVYVKHQQQQMQQTQERQAAQVSEWAQALKVDKEFGGGKFDASQGAARKAIERFGSDGLKELLNTTGLGNHPELVRVFVRVGKALAEDSVAGTAGAGAGAPANNQDAFLRALYPTMYSEK